MYCAPFNASRVLVVDTFNGMLSFLEGAGEKGGSKYAGICAGADGKLYCAPHSASARRAAIWD